MPRTSPDFIPAYREHKATGQACVTLSGRTFYLGRYGTKESRAEYDRLTSEWLSCGRRLTDADGGLTVSELILAYLHYAKARYASTNEYGCYKDALRVVKELYGKTLAAEFGPRRFKTVREKFLEKDWSRPYANRQAQRVRRVIKWAVSEELLPGECLHRLTAVEGLRRGDPGTRETEPVRPVPEAFIEAVKPHVSPQVRAMIELQSLTAMRPGEVCIMRTCDLETSGRVWVFCPQHHKTKHHGHKREIYLGPRAQEVLGPWLRPNLEEHLFQPAKAMAWKSAEKRKNRKTPLWPSNLEAKERQKRTCRRRHYQERYTVSAYRRAIRRACIVAGVPEWSPNQLRHNAATWLRKKHGIELARIVLGHATAFTTEIYAEADRAQAMEVIAKVG
jgi:integrase